MSKTCLPALLSAIISLSFVVVSINSLQISIANNVQWKIIACIIAILIFTAAIILNIVTIKKLRCFNK